MVIPSIYPSLHDPEVYEDPHLLLPERWLDLEGKANANPKNFLVFGAGPHRCIGVEYTNINMACVMGNAAALLDWEHVRTPDSDEVQMIATSVTTPFMTHENMLTSPPESSRRTGAFSNLLLARSRRSV